MNEGLGYRHDLHDNYCIMKEEGEEEFGVVIISRDPDSIINYVAFACLNSPHVHFFRLSAHLDLNHFSGLTFTGLIITKFCQLINCH